MVYRRLLFSLWLSSMASTKAFTVTTPIMMTRSNNAVVAVPQASNTALFLEMPDVDPLVLAAAGLALVGGIGASAISSKLRDMDGTDERGAAAPATADDSVDISIPYDAAARLAYEKAGSKGDYEAFKTKYEADAVAEVKAKNAGS